MDSTKKQPFALYSSSQELVIDFAESEQRIILSPLIAKKLCLELQQNIVQFEEKHGIIPWEKSEKSVLQSVKEHLFYRKKVSQNVFAVNPRKKEK